MSSNEQTSGILLGISSLVILGNGALYAFVTLITGLMGLGFGGVGLLGVLAEGELEGLIGIGLMGGAFGVFVLFLVAFVVLFFAVGGFSAWAAFKAIGGDGSKILPAAAASTLLCAAFGMLSLISLSPMAMLWLLAFATSLIAAILSLSDSTPPSQTMV